MNWFCKKYSACQQCKVHFEPAQPHERHPELCPEHRKPVVELEDRILRVMAWAKANWEKLEPQALEEDRKMHAAMQASFSQMANNMAGAGLGNAGAAAGNPFAR